MGLCEAQGGWSAALTLPWRWGPFAHGSSLLKIFASEVLPAPSTSSQSSRRTDGALHGAAGPALHLIVQSEKGEEGVSVVFMLREIHDPQGSET